MTSPDLERRIRTWFADEIDETEGAPLSVYAFLGAIPQSMPWEQGLFGRRAFALLAAAVLLVGLLAGAIAVGSGLLKLPVILPPDPSPSPEATLQPSPASPTGLVAYLLPHELQPGQGDCTGLLPRLCNVQRIWIANADGTDPHELMPGGFDNQELIAWSSDGSRLLYRNSNNESLGITDVPGSAPRLIQREALCPVDNCPILDFRALSPDGTRLAGVFGDNSTVIALFDIATGQITELQSTATTNPDLPCDTEAQQGVNSLPQWSPDGTRLLFARSGMGPRDENGDCRSAIFTVSADGTDLRQIVSTEVSGGGKQAHWSPDGALIVFSAGGDVIVDHEVVSTRVAVYTVRPDGSGLRQLTTDGASMGARWTEDGRVVFLHGIGDWVGQDTFELLIMGADGSKPATLNSWSLSDLAAAQCIVCPYNLPDGQTDAMWQPTP